MAETLPAESGIGRVALRVGDLAETVAFYRDVVGLEVRSPPDSGGSDDGATDDGTDDASTARTATLGTAETPLLELRGDPGAPARPDTAAGLFHTAVRVPTRAALGDALGRVRERWRLTGASDHLVSEALYLRDPEGNGVEIYCDRPREEWPTDDGRVAMTTDPLDLDALAARAAAEECVPSGTDIGHVHLEVTSLSAARGFYGDALGMAVRQEMDGALFLAAGDYHHHVGCNVWNGRSTPAEGRGLEWFEVVVPDESALAAVRERFADRGVETVPAGDGGSAVDDTESAVDATGFSVDDPDGIGLRIRVAGTR